MEPTRPTPSCPWCRQAVATTPGDWNRIVRCHCGQQFHLGPRPSRTAPARSYPWPRLTHPHRCPHHGCRQPWIERVLNGRVVTLRHEECLATVTLEASLYRCPWCLKGEVFESPQYQWGQVIACPDCPEHEFTVPDDLVLRDRTDDGGGRFQFACPGCQAPLECARRWARRWAVCTSCVLALQIPEAGHALPGVGDRGDPPPPSIEMGALTRCPVCTGHYPRRCGRCPSCAHG